MEIELCDFGSFKIYQPKNGYRFSFEPFYLANIESTKRYKVAIDIGSGCGIIAILLSKNASFEKIFALENNQEYIELIKENIKLNQTANIEIIDSIEKVPNISLDLAISNPPFYTKTSFRVSNKYESQKFEHMPLSEIIKSIKPKMKHNALYRLAFHPTRLYELLNVLNTNGFGVKTIQPIYGKKNTISKSCIIEAKYLAKTYITLKSPIFLEDHRLF